MAPGVEPARRSQAVVFGAAGALTVLGTGLWYAWAIRSQGDSLTTPTPLFVLSSLATVMLLTAVGMAFRERRAAAVALWAATGALLMLGLIGLFSIGIFLLLAGGMMMTAAVGSRRRSGVRWVPCLVGALAGAAPTLASFAAVASVD